MKSGCPSLIGNLFVVAVLPVLVGTGCKSQNQAVATLPPASSSLYPASVDHTPPADGSSIWSANDIEPVKAMPQKQEPKPFKLRSGETLASYKVQKGDNLSKIAKRYGTSVSRIQAANGLTSTKILAGKSYKVPTTKSADEIAAVNSATPTTIEIAPSRPEPPSPPAYDSKPATIISSSPSRPQSYKPVSDTYKSVSDAYKSYNANASQARTYSPPPSSSRPVFTPRNDFDFNGPQISTPTNSITVPTEEVSSGSGSAFPSPSIGSGSY